MANKVIWQKYIEAQYKILEFNSRPIRIGTSNEIRIEGLKLKLSVDQELYKNVFRKEIERVFKITDFDYSQNYILTDLGIVDTDEFKNGIKGLKELAENCYIELNENPVIDGVIKVRNDEIRKGDAVLSIKPSISYLISTFYKELDISQSGSRIIVAGELHSDILNLFANYFGMSKRGNSLIFKFKNIEYVKERVKELERVGLTFPQPENNVLTFYYANEFYEKNGSDLNCEVYRLKRSLKENFPYDEFEFSYETYYNYDVLLIKKGTYELNRNEDDFWRRLDSEIPGDIFNINMGNRTISFDYESEESLNTKLELLKSFTFLDIYERGQSRKDKLYIKFQTDLHELQGTLERVNPNLFTKLIANGEELIFRQFYKSRSKTEILARLKNDLDSIISTENHFDRFTYIINDTFQEKYLCEENFELKVEQEEEKLSKLMREDFFVCDEDNKKVFDIGTLTKVKYPNLTFTIEAENLEIVRENIASYKNKIPTIKPDLKGERDKIERLRDTVRKLDSNEMLPNNNAKLFLNDSSKAKVTENIEYLLNKTSVEWKEFENSLFSKSLNESQRIAIYKSLYAKELALIQGPPGTGKSTAIAEIIWQHLRKDHTQKILLTSETNLAVDNAIDRLKNSQNNIVKPIRFGKADNLESEGYFYSLDAIDDWQNSNISQKNTVAHWINNIVTRIRNHDDEEIESALKKWRNYLQDPNFETKKLFANIYLDNVNLIGATGSSIGKLNSEKRWTSFFRYYLNVFHREKFVNGNISILNRIDINFDTIIMDEASKATPPELALPVLYGKKSIIVGDHRQLPPMIDGEEIKDLLISIGEKELAKTLSQKEFEISQFERLFTNIDESIKGTFDTQYRMHPAINDVIAQFYKKDSEKGLQCGLPLDETYHNSFDKWDSRYHGLKFRDIITPETHTIWINVTKPEIHEGTSRVNYGEIQAINNLLNILKNCDGKTEFDNWLENQPQEEKQIGIISFYGKQLSNLEQMLLKNHKDLYKGKGRESDKVNLVRLSTVDRFQGMERNIIIISMVRSNIIASSQGQEPDKIYGELGYPVQSSLGFAESPNRLNVALSRARRLLIVVGNSEHFCKKDIYKNVFETIKQNGKIISSDELQNTVEQNGYR